jgi:hypothetical protein
MSSFLTAFTLKSLRIEWYTPRDVAVAEHERLTAHLSDREADALLAHAKALDHAKKATQAAADAEAEASARRPGSPSSGGSGGSGGGGGGSGGRDTQDLSSPTVKVDAAVLQRLHSSMSDAERGSVGHMSNRKLRSSFVDNAPAEQSYFARAEAAAATSPSPRGWSSPGASFGSDAGSGSAHGEGEGQRRRSVGSVRDSTATPSRSERYSPGGDGSNSGGDPSSAGGGGYPNSELLPPTPTSQEVPRAGSRAPAAVFSSDV